MTHPLVFLAWPDAGQTPAATPCDTVEQAVAAWCRHGGTGPGVIARHGEACRRPSAHEAGPHMLLCTDAVAEDLDGRFSLSRIDHVTDARYVRVRFPREMIPSGAVGLRTGSSFRAEPRAA